MSKFGMGKTVMTRAINDTINGNEQFAKEIITALYRYMACDWGDMCREDKALNDNAVKSGNDRVVAAYDTSKGGIYIITEWDRSCTTILFKEEY